jgi:hypothetical protein
LFSAFDPSKGGSNELNWPVCGYAAVPDQFVQASPEAGFIQTSQ